MGLDSGLPYQSPRPRCCLRGPGGGLDDVTFVIPPMKILREERESLLTNFGAAIVMCSLEPKWLRW